MDSNKEHKFILRVETKGSPGKTKVIQEKEPRFPIMDLETILKIRKGMLPQNVMIRELPSHSKRLGKKSVYNVHKNLLSMGRNKSRLWLRTETPGASTPTFIFELFKNSSLRSLSSS